MAIERILKVKEPALFDKVVTSIQDTLGESLPWLDHVFGVAERLIKETNGVRRYTPNIYIGNNEYLCMLPDETLGNFSFFVLDDPAEVAWARGERNRLTVPYSLVVWLDMRTVGDGKTRNRERVKDDILKVMNGGLRLRNGHAVVTAVYERAENVYDGFNIDEVDNQFMMAPYAAFRFEGTMMVDEDCY